MQFFPNFSVSNSLRVDPLFQKKERVYETKSKSLLRGFWISGNLIYAAFV